MDAERCPPAPGWRRPKGQSTAGQANKTTVTDLTVKQVTQSPSHSQTAGSAVRRELDTA